MILSLRGVLHHFNNRISEVGHAMIMVGLGVQIMAAPVTSFRALDLMSRFVSGRLFCGAFPLGWNDPHGGADRQRQLAGIWTVAKSHWRFIGSLIWFSRCF